MRLPTLMARYRILYPLGLPPSNRIFLAEDLETSEQVVLKFMTDTDSFFESLARFYTCDQMGITPGILENVPPYRVSRDRAMMSSELLHFLRFPILPQDEAEWLNHPAADLSMLVMEHIEGPLFKDYVAGLQTDDEKARALAQLTLAVDALHARGEFHGRLLADHVLWDINKARPVLLSLGYTPYRRTETKGVSPEHLGDSYHDITTATDIYMLAHFFLIDHVDCLPRLADYVHQAMDPNPLQRPPSDQMLEVFASVSPLPHEGEMSTQKRSQPLGIPFISRLKKPFYWIFASIMLSLTGFTLVTAWPNRPDTTDLIEKHALDPGAADSLRTKHNIPKNGMIDQSLQRNLAKDLSIIAQKKGFPVKPATAQDLLRPLAVFAFADSPIILGINHHFELGDWIHHKGRKGYIASILWNHIQVQFEGELKDFPLEEAGFSEDISNYETGVVIWKRHGNLGPLMVRILAAAEARGTIHDWPDIYQRLRSWETGHFYQSKETFFGTFRSASLDEFAQTFASSLTVQEKDGRLNIVRAEGKLPIHVRRQFYETNGFTLEKLAENLASEFGISVSATKGQERAIPSNLWDSMTYEEILQALGIAWQFGDESNLEIDLSMIDPEPSGVEPP